MSALPRSSPNQDTNTFLFQMPPPKAITQIHLDDIVQAELAFVVKGWATGFLSILPP